MRLKLFKASSFVFILLVGCTKHTAQLEYGLDLKDTLRINVQREPPTLDWERATDVTSALILENTMDTLLDYNYSDPEFALVPSLATAWAASEGGKIWTFTLRKGVKWTDGVDFTAQQVIDGWERLLNPATASEYAYFIFAIKNAQAYNAKKITDFSKVGVKINEQGQLVVELEKPISYFPLLVTHLSTAPLRKDVIAKFGDTWTEPGHIQTLGAYKLKIWDHDKAVVLERNDDYFQEKAKVKNILGYVIPEYSTALNLYDSGELDFQETIPFLDLPRYKNNPGFKVATSLSIYYYGFNTRKPPFNDVKVRQAFAHAIDHKQITDLLGGGQTPLTAWVPKGMFGYQSDIGLKFDPALAAQLLDAAGFKDRKKFPQVTIAFDTNENYQRIAENIQAQLLKNLGVKVQVTSEEWKVYLNRLKTDVPDIFRMGWLADYPDPDNFMSLMTSYSDNNKTGWKNAKYDQLIGEGAGEQDKEKRRAIYAQAQRILTETDTAVIPLYSDVRPLLLSGRVQNFTVNSLNHWVFKGVTLQ